MRPLIRTVLFIAIPCAAIIGGGAFFLYSNDATVEAKLRNSEVFFAETPGIAAASSSVNISIASASVAISTSTPGSTSTTSARVPILVYHIVRPSYPTDSKGVKALAQTPEIFDAQMKHLQDAGYHVVSFATLEDSIKKGTVLPPKPVVITFDDGWKDQFIYAFPILQKYHYTATFFIFTNPIGRRSFLSWDELKTLRDAGMTIGSHTLSHPFLTKITDPIILNNEIVKSKQVLEKNLGITVNEFAYPFGQYSASIEAAVVSAGYTAARGDYVKRGDVQSVSKLYELSALNAPTSIGWFNQVFP